MQDISVRSIILTLPNRPPAVLDSVIAEQFGTETKAINKARYRNPERFPEDFAFQLTKQEVELIRNQNGTFKEKQWVTGIFTYLPWAYTEEGVAMIAGILNTPRAIEASVCTLRLFRELRQELYVAKSALAHIHKTVLASNPTWRSIHRYKGLGLNHREIAKLVNLNVSTVRKHVREMEQCGLLTPPKDLPMLQKMLLNFEGGAS